MWQKIYICCQLVVNLFLLCRLVGLAGEKLIEFIRDGGAYLAHISIISKDGKINNGVIRLFEVETHL